MIVTGDYRNAIAKSVRQLAIWAGDDPDQAEANYWAESAARAEMVRAIERDVDDSGFESREDRERDALGGWGAGEDRALTRYERSRGL